MNVRTDPLLRKGLDHVTRYAISSLASRLALQGLARHTAPTVANATLALSVLLFATTVSFRDARAGEQVDLRAAQPVGSHHKVTAILEASGKLRLNADGRGVQEVPVAIEGRLSYIDRIVARNEEGGTHRVLPHRVVRRYDEAKGKIHVRKWEIKTSLGKSRRLIAVAKKHGKPLVYYSPLGPLTTQDLDILQLQFDPLAVAEILPSEPVEDGSKWKVAPATLATLMGMDAVLESKVRATVSAIEDAAVRIELAGTMEGTVDGVSSRIELRGKLRWDRTLRRVTWVAVHFHERRDISHTAPGFDTEARLRIQISPHRVPIDVDDELLKKVAQGPDAPELLVALASQSGFELLHPRTWKQVIDGPDVTVLRLVDKGELIAQANISRVNEAKDLTLGEFQREVEQALGKKFQQWVAADEKQNGDIHLFHLIAAGETEGLSIQWIYYHLRDGAGRRATVAFTIESKLMEQFAGADEQLVSTLKLVDPADAKKDSTTDAAGATREAKSAAGPVRQ